MESLEQPAEGFETRPAPTFAGNSNDLVALIGATISGVGIACCATAGNAVYCLPVVGLVLGIIGWIQANQAVDSERARKLSMFSTISMAAVFALIILAILAYFAFIIVMIVFASMSSTG